MGYLNVSSRIAVLSLSLGLLALAGCQLADQKSPEAADQSPAAVSSDTLQDVTCPGDPRCGQRTGATGEKFPAMCTVSKTHAVAFLCGDNSTERRRCPGPGCPTGQPRPEDRCEIDLRVTVVDCKKVITEVQTENDAAQDDPPPSAAPAQPVPVPAEKAAE